MKHFRRCLDAASVKDAIEPHNFYLREQDLCCYGCRSGPWAIAGTCPFHEDRNPGSFKVNLETGAFKCWSCGAKGGDIIAFLQKKEGIGFVEVLERLGNEWGVV